MNSTIKHVIIMLALLNFLIILPFLFIINGHFWLDLYFIFWYIIFLELWLVFICIFKKKARKVIEDKREDFTLSMTLFLSCFLGLLFSQGVARTPQFWFPWLWISIKLIFIIPLTLLYFSKCQRFREHKNKPIPSSKIKKWINNYSIKLASIKINKKLFVPLLAFLLVFQTLFFFPLLTNPVISTIAERNINELQKLVRELTEGLEDDENKTKSILKWFDRYTGNIYNTWAPPAITTISSNNVYFSIAFGDPYFPILCVRNDGDNNPLWILTSRCGNCGEHSLLFTEMTLSANLTVRTVQVNGVDHKWNEILIQNKSIIADPSWVVLKNSETGYNISSEKYEKTFGNFTYVYALFKDNNTKIDVTRNYTKVAHINITTVDEQFKPISNTSIRVYSNDLGNKIDTGLIIHTNDSGKYDLNIGGSNVTFECENKQMNLYNSTTKIFYEEQNYDLFLIMKAI